MEKKELLCLLGCYIGAFVNFTVLVLLLHHIFRYSKLKKPLYWCFVVQCSLDFISCWIDSFDYHWFGSYFLRKFSNEEISAFYLLSSWATAVTSLVWKFAFFQKLYIAIFLAVISTILTFLIISKNVCSLSCSLYDLDNPPEGNDTVSWVITAVVTDNAIFVSPLLFNTLFTVGCMVAVLLLPSKEYSGSILIIYRKVSACLVFRVLSTLVNCFLILARMINTVYLYVIILAGVEVFGEEIMIKLEEVTNYAKPAHICLYSVSPLTILWLMQKLLLTPVVKILPATLSTFTRASRITTAA